MTNVGIFCSVIPERHNLLLRSIRSWWWSALTANVDLNVLVYTEGYDGTEKWPKGPMGLYKHFSEKRTGSPEVGSNFLWNTYKDQVDIAIFTHPEIMFGEGVVSEAVEYAIDKTYVTFRPFWIPKYLTEHWDEYDFKYPDDCEQCDELYQYGPDINGPQKYLNLGIRESKTWESDTTWAGSKSTINEIFPLPEFGAWGPIDPYLYQVRGRMNHRKVIPEACVYHQDHTRIEGGPPGYAVQEALRAFRERFK